MVASAVQRFAALQQRGGEFFGALDSRMIDGLSDAVEFAVGGIKHDHTPLSEEFRVQSRESRAHGFTGTIGLAQEDCCVVVAQQSCGLLQWRQNLVAEVHRTDGCSGNVVAGCRESLQRAISAGKRNVIHFGEIMIVRREPEYRNRFDAGRGSLFCQLDRSKRFVEGKHRAAEKTDLLTGYDCGRTVAEAIEIGESLRRSVPGL